MTTSHASTKAFHSETVIGVDFGGQHFVRQVFEDCVFERCSFRGVLLSLCLVTNVVFRDCDFSEAIIEWSDFKNVDIVDCSFREASVENVKLTLGCEGVRNIDMNGLSLNRLVYEDAMVTLEPRWSTTEDCVGWFEAQFCALVLRTN